MSTSNSALPTLSRTRYWVVVYAVVLSVITYVDRVSISQAAPLISEELGLSRVQMGWAFSAFSLGYFLFQIPGGWMGDWVGPRRVLTGIVIWWSVFTAATGWVWNLVTLIAARLLFGVGQAGGFPVLTKTFTAWLPRDEQVRAQGIMWLSARWGGAAAPMIVVTLLQFVSWRRTFEVLGLLGLIWAIFFWRWYRDSPRDHADVSQAELAIIGSPEAGTSGQGAVPWARFLSSPSVWFLFLQYFCISWGWYFYITWLPTYIQEARGQTMEQSALLAGIPLFFGGIGSLFCGFILSRLGTLLGSERLARRVIAGLGNFSAGACLVVSVHITEPLWAVVAMGFASFANDLSMPPAWAACMDLGGRYAGALSGAMNAAGNLAGFIAPPTVAYILSATGDNWPLTFYVSAGTYFVAALCWIKIDPVTSLDRRD